MDSFPPGIFTWALRSYEDARGRLIELFRSDTLPDGFFPEMSYISITHPGVSRGPHEHVEQSDLFAFMDGEYELRLWDNRPGSDGWKICLRVGSENPLAVIVPQGVIHGYRNVGDRDAYVLNFPNALYAGKDRKEKVDEIRHEEIDSPYSMEGPF